MVATVEFDTICFNFGLLGIANGFETFVAGTIVFLGHYDQRTLNSAFEIHVHL